MKKLSLVLILLATVSSIITTAYAQGSGVITYEITIDNHRLLPPEMDGRKAMIPQFRTFKEQLFFNANESLYKPLIEDEEEDTHAGGGGGGRILFRVQGQTNYVDQANNTILTQMDLMGKRYLITDTLKPAPWKFGTETKVIQGYECAQAFYTTEGDRKQTITAWFTTKLRANLGPDRYNTLPGAILAVDINNGERVLVAKKVELRELKKNELKVPKEGEKVTQAEFRQKGEELRKQFGGRGGNVIIR